MKKLYINNISGIYDELYNPGQINETCDIILNNHLNSNILFWKHILDENRINNLLNIVLQHDDIQETYIPQILAVQANPDEFKKNVDMALERITDQSISEKEFFRHIETLSILCTLYTKFEFSPFELRINEGLIPKYLSTKDISKIALHPIQNPYYKWIKKTLLPAIINYQPKLIYLEGKPSLFSLSLGKMIKRQDPNIHICITRHASEYYSLNKIDIFLKNNRYLFNMVDSIILEFFEHTEEMLEKSIENHTDLRQINNIIYIEKNGKIAQNPYQKDAENKAFFQERKVKFSNSYGISPKHIMNVHIEPYKKCYWNKCSFCGINKKYHYLESYAPDVLEYELNRLAKKIQTNRIKYIWFIDEALHPQVLSKIADFFIRMDLKILWQARCRIDSGLLETNLAERLFLSGLRELRLGLESGSMRILQRMKKFSGDFDISLVEKIVAHYDAKGISIHTPVIIGFPGEVRSDRQKTYSLLRHLKQKYPSYSFNINIFEMDISSPIYKDWENFDIKSITLPALPSEYIGNFALWESAAYDRYVLEKERDQLMRELLYSWMPMDSITKPYIFYRLSENIRNTLIWKSNIQESGTTDFSENTANRFLKFSNHQVFMFIDEKQEYLVYQWKTHHYFRASMSFMKLYEQFKKTITINECIELLVKCGDSYTYDKCRETVNKLIQNGFLVTENINTEQPYIKEYVEYYYDELYQKRKFPYSITQDTWLTRYKQDIPIGKALEIGIGTGKNIPYLLEQGYQVCGIDLSEVVIKELKERYTACNFSVADIREYIIPNKHFDLIVCSMMLHYICLEDVIAVAKKIYAGLKRGGCLYLSVLSEKDPMYNSLSSKDSLIKTFFNIEMIAEIFSPLKILQISDNYIFEPKRIAPKQYFGIIQYLAKKEGDD